MPNATAIQRLVDLGRGYVYARSTARRDYWNRQQMAAYQKERLDAVIAHARAHSPFYRQMYADLPATVALTDLPILTKRQFRERFDDIVTDRRLRLGDVEMYAAGPNSDRYFDGRYKVLTTSGTSGPKSYSVFNRSEWSTLLSGHIRRRMMTGITSGPFSRQRTSEVRLVNRRLSGHHVNLATKAGRGMRRVQVIPNNLGMPRIVETLNEFQPHVLNGYPSTISELAVEQIEGRLAIEPRAINCGAEAISSDLRDRSLQAWGTTPFDAYGLTEVGRVASECSDRRLHVFEDRVIIEPVGDDYQPVEPGATASRLLVTSLFKLAQPVIRYEVDDLVTMSDEACSCGRSLMVIASVAGRSAEMLVLPRAGGGVAHVSPVQLWAMVKIVPEVLHYQVTSQSPLSLRIVLRQGAEPSLILPRIRATLLELLAGAGVTPGLEICFEVVERIEPNPQSGKLERTAREAGLTPAEPPR